MTVKELITELLYYDPDLDVSFEIDAEFEPEEITTNRHGYQTVRVKDRLKEDSFIEYAGAVHIEFDIKEG